MAIMNLAADNKWLVSGMRAVSLFYSSFFPKLWMLTSITCPSVFRNAGQHKFQGLEESDEILGLEHVEEIFNVFIRTAFKDTDDQCVPKRLNGEDLKIGPFMFLLRCIMIRHTQKQTYLGTTTTLMSLPPKVRDFK